MARARIMGSNHWADAVERDVFVALWFLCRLSCRLLELGPRPPMGALMKNVEIVAVGRQLPVLRRRVDAVISVGQTVLWWTARLRSSRELARLSAVGDSAPRSLGFPRTANRRRP
jgi:hypothetical protein